MKVLVISGGNSDEREISLLSAENVCEALRKKLHQVELVDFREGFEKLKDEIKDFDVVFPVLHGSEGEGGILQEFLEEQKVRFVGSDSKACRASWNKIEFKNFCEKSGIKTSPWIVLKPQNKDSLVAKIPFVVKPQDSGSSVDVYIIKSQEDLDKLDLKKLFNKYKELLVEDYIEGIEATVGVLGDDALPVVEIRPPEGEWFSYENKYSGKTKEIPDAPSLTNEQKQELQKITSEIHRGLGCRHFSRSDFIVGKDGIYALEINVIPGLTKESLLPKAAQAAGISFEEMMERLINMASKSA